MTRFPRYRATTLAGLMALGILAGCSSSEPETAPTETPETVSDAPTPEADAPVPATIAQPTGLQPPDVVPETAPVEPNPPDAQVLEDADATGMTARVRRDEATPMPAPEETPVQADPAAGNEAQ